MKILDSEIEKTALKNCENLYFDEMVKAVVDVSKQIVAIDAPMHADLEQFLLSQGSHQDNLWGINLHFDDPDDDFVEFDSMINIRPRQNNRSRDVEDPENRAKIIEVVKKWIK